MEHQDTATTEKEIRGVGTDPMRAMFWNVRPVVCSFQENAFRPLGSRPNGSGLALSEVPRDGGTQRTRGYVRDDNRDHYTPSKFGIKLCQMWMDAIGTADEEYRLNAYDLYIDRVIFNPNI